jgi:hypothetical protein
MGAAFRADIALWLFDSPRMRYAVRPSLLRKEGEEKNNHKVSPLSLHNRKERGEFSHDSGVTASQNSPIYIFNLTAGLNLTARAICKQTVMATTAMEITKATTKGARDISIR